MSAFFQKSLGEIIDLAASDMPTPGGGSISALVACLGLTMTGMVGNLTVDKKGYQDIEPQIKEMLTEINKMLVRLENLLEQDMRAFARFMEALRLPKETPAEISIRTSSMEKSLHDATEIPLQIARVCIKALELNSRMVKIGNRTAVSDAGVAAITLEAALNGVLLSAEANTKMLKDPAFVHQVNQECKAMSTVAAHLKEESLRVMRER